MTREASSLTHPLVYLYFPVQFRYLLCYSCWSKLSGKVAHLALANWSDQLFVLYWILKISSPAFLDMFINWCSTTAFSPFLGHSQLGYPVQMRLTPSVWFRALRLDIKYKCWIKIAQVSLVQEETWRDRKKSVIFLWNSMIRWCLKTPGASSIN